MGMERGVSLERYAINMSSRRSGLSSAVLPLQQLALLLRSLSSADLPRYSIHRETRLLLGHSDNLPHPPLLPPPHLLPPNTSCDLSPRLPSRRNLRMPRPSTLHLPPLLPLRIFPLRLSHDVQRLARGSPQQHLARMVRIVLCPPPNTPHRRLYARFPIPLPPKEPAHHLTTI